MSIYTFILNNHSIKNFIADNMAEAESRAKIHFGYGTHYDLLAVDRNLYKIEGGRYVTYSYGSEPAHLTGTELNKIVTI